MGKAATKIGHGEWGMGDRGMLGAGTWAYHVLDWSRSVGGPDVGEAGW